MATTLAEKFTEFAACFSVFDVLCGTFTSNLQTTNADFLLRDVCVDLPGRKSVRDFVSQGGNLTRVYDFTGPDWVVTSCSARRNADCRCRQR